MIARCLLACVAVALASSVSASDGGAFVQSRAEYRERDARAEFVEFAPGLCLVKRWVGVQITPDVEWVYEGLCSAGGSLVRHDYCVRMARGGGQ